MEATEVFLRAQGLKPRVFPIHRRGSSRALIQSLLTKRGHVYPYTRIHASSLGIEFRRFRVAHPSKTLCASTRIETRGHRGLRQRICRAFAEFRCIEHVANACATVWNWTAVRERHRIACNAVRGLSVGGCVGWQGGAPAGQGAPNRKRASEMKGASMQLKRYSTVRVLALCLFTALVSTLSLRAQEVTASITGVVSDPTGAMVAAAKVTAGDLDRGTMFSTVTDSAGAYNLARLPVGRYQVKVASTGFETAVQPKVELVINQVAKIDFRLKVGNVSESVEVTGAAPILQSETTTVGTVLQSDAITSLPLETTQLQPTDSADSRLRHDQPRARSIPGSRPSTPAAPISTAIANRRTTTCWTAWRTWSSSTTTSPTRRTWTRSKNSTSLPTIPRPTTDSSWAASLV